MTDRTKPGLFGWTGPPAIDLEAKAVTIGQLAREGAILGAVGCRAGAAIRRGDFVRFGSEIRNDLAPWSVVELLPMPGDWSAKLNRPGPLGVAMCDYSEARTIPMRDTLMTMARKRPVAAASEKGRVPCEAPIGRGSSSSPSSGRRRDPGPHAFAPPPGWPWPCCCPPPSPP